MKVAADEKPRYARWRSCRFSSNDPLDQEELVLAAPAGDLPSITDGLTAKQEGRSSTDVKRPNNGLEILGGISSGGEFIR